MGQGLQIWDASGNLIFDTAHFIGRITDVLDIPASASGSATINVLPEGTRFQFLMPASGTFTPGGEDNAPTISIVGTTLTYVNAVAKGFKLILGVY